MGGGGSPNIRQKEQNQLICDSDKGEESVKNSEHFADAIYGSPQKACPILKFAHRQPIGQSRKVQAKFSQPGTRLLVKLHLYVRTLISIFIVHAYSHNPEHDALACMVSSHSSKPVTYA